MIISIRKPIISFNYDYGYLIVRQIIHKKIILNYEFIIFIKHNKFSFIIETNNQYIVTNKRRILKI
jgi:hypothetical protein